MIDSHCHLQYDYSPRTLAEIFTETQAEGIQALINVGTNIDDSRKISQTRSLDVEVFHTVGVHPHDSGQMQDGTATEILELSKHPNCVAIGEIGLDYHYNHSAPADQKRRLDEQLEIAIAAKKPVVIHAREAEEDLINALTRYSKNVPSDFVPGVIHCFSGTRKFGEACLEMGFYISFSGILTFKNSQEIKECARDFPEDRILIETDAPFLAPIPFRGKKCTPSMLKQTALVLAGLRGTTLSAIDEITTRNTIKAFELKMNS